MNDSKRTPQLGSVLYDGACGVCRRLVVPWTGTLRRHGFDVAPLQSDWVAPRLNLPKDELLSDVRLVLADGTHRQGADVYRYVFRRIWWATPLYLFSITPLLRNVFDWCYRLIADHRHEISGACGLPDQECDVHGQAENHGFPDAPESGDP